MRKFFKESEKCVEINAPGSGKTPDTVVRAKLSNYFSYIDTCL